MLEVRVDTTIICVDPLAEASATCIPRPGPRLRCFP
jgi:hypothetical protein